jgi:hypothetical protein
MSQPAFQFFRQCMRRMFTGKHISHRAKTATVLTVSAKHASTTSGMGTSDTPLMESKSAIKTDRNWDWLPLQPQYQAARKTIVMCHGILRVVLF